MLRLVEDGNVLTLSVRAVPRASRSGIVGEHDGALKIRIASPPVDGAANEELIRFLSKLTGVPRSQIDIVGGLASKSKIVRICGIDAVRFRQLCGLK